MQDYIYSVIGLIAIVIHLIINFNVMFKPEHFKLQKASANYRYLMIAIFVYYITDVLWGFFAGLNWIPQLFLDTTIYYVAMSSAIVFYYRYIVEYLGFDGWRASVFKNFGAGFFILENLCLIINFFYPCFFWFDANDAYIAGPIRYLALWIQVVMFAFSTIVTGMNVFQLTNEKVARKRQLAIFFFSLIMFIAILFQERYPLLPFYALGCLLGSCVLHEYVVGDELEEYQEMLKQEKNKLEDYSGQLSSYKRAVLSDALISLEVNLSKDVLYFGIWKDDNKQEVPLQQIIGLSIPCSYDRYVKIWNEHFVKTVDSVLFEGRTDREYLLDSFDKGRTEVTFDYEAKTISGRNVWLRRNIAMIKNKAGDVLAYTSVKDITELVEQAKREEAYIRSLATDYDSIVIIGYEENKYDDKVILHSRVSDELASLIDEETANEVHYSKKLDLMLKFIHPEDREPFYAATRRERSNEFFKENKTNIVNFRIMKPDDSYLYYQFRIVSLKDDSGKLIGQIATMRNIDAEIRREIDAKEEMKKAKIAAEAANLAKSTFLFNMSHDIRTPMNAIIGFTDIAEKHIDDQDRVKEALGKVKMASDHLLTLINDVLDMSRIESGTVKIEEEAVCLGTANDNLFNLLDGSAEAKNIHFTVRIDPSVSHHWFYADRLRMMRVLMNVISNSVKYTKPGGKIDMLAEELPCEKEGYAHYRYTISDTGIGMSKEFLAHIFEPFSRAESATKSGIIGTGLGMAITKSLVELMGGTITVESKLNVGTTVRMDFENRIAEPVLPKSEIPEGKFVNLKGKKILLVEDNELNREIATEILTEEGIIIDTAEDGDVAVEKMRYAEAGQYDLILMDIQMPRMNGYEATRAIRKLPDPYAAGIPIIAMTANAFSEDKENAFEAGMNGHIAKPIDVPVLLDTLSDIFS